MQQLKKTKPFGVKKTCWWKLSEGEYRDKLFQEVEAKLRGETEKTWGTLSTETGKEVLVCTLGKKGKKGKNEETGWWCTEVREAVKEKKERKREGDLGVKRH